jgi:hypothetical protein
MAKKNLPRHRKHSKGPARKPPPPETPATAPAQRPAPAAMPGLQSSMSLAECQAAVAAMSDKEKTALLAGIDSRESTFAQTRGARLRMAARHILWTGGFRREDLQRMVRGQFLTIEELAVCEEYAPRLHSQIHLNGPIDPVPFPRNELCCPLEDRGRLDDVTVPCCHAQSLIEIRRPPPIDDKAERRLREEAMQYTLDNETRPCEVLGNMAWQNVEMLLGLPRDWAPPPDSDALRQQLQQRAQALRAQAADNKFDVVEALRFLLEAGRLSMSDLRTMIELYIPVTDRKWLPCRDDPKRKRVYSAGGIASFDKCCCPLQVQALLGDRTVPCPVALSAQPEPALVREAEKALAAEDPDDREPRPALVRYWDSDDEAPGGPDDLVRRLGAVPCHLLGTLLAHRLPDWLELLATDMDWYARDAAVLGWQAEEAAPTEAAPAGEEAVWPAG